MVIINAEHPLILDTHIKDKNGTVKHFTYIDIKNKPTGDLNEGYIAQGEEAIIKKGSNDVRDITYKHWSDFDFTYCPYDYFIKGEKNPPVGRINYMVQELYRYLSKQEIKEMMEDAEKLR